MAARSDSGRSLTDQRLPSSFFLHNAVVISENISWRMPDYRGFGQALPLRPEILTGNDILTIVAPVREILASLLAVVFLTRVCFSQTVQTLPSSLLQDLSISIGSGARALGMGGAFIAVADDATAASWNPAGLCVLEKPEVSIVWKPYSRIVNSSPLEVGEEKIFTDTFLLSNSPFSTVLTGNTVDFLSGAYPVELGRIKLVPQVSYQRTIDVGLQGSSSTQINRIFYVNNGQDQISAQSNQTEASGGIDIWSASMGFSFDPRLFLGVSVNRWTGNPKSQLVFKEGGTTCTVDRCIHNSPLETSSFVEESYEGLNVNIGALVRPHKKLRIGVVYKTPFEMRLLRNGVVSGGLDFGYTELGKVSWPSTFGAGISVLPKIFCDAADPGQRQALRQNREPLSAETRS